MTERSSPFLERSPGSPEEWEGYYDLRWRVLRGPWGQPRGSERDECDADSFHAALWDGDAPVAAGRLHFNSPLEGQIRYMAVDPNWRGLGLGGRILACLEGQAVTAGAGLIVLNAREEVAAFYARHGYRDVGSAGLLFGVIPHLKMEKKFANL